MSGSYSFITGLEIYLTWRSTLGVNGMANAMNRDDGKEAMDLDDPRVPDTIRVHGLRFRKPARFVVDLGNGELLDPVYLK